MSTATVNNFHSQPRSRGLSILVIDDEAGIQTLLQQTLAGEGYYVRMVGTGRHALNLIRDEGFDVVISDISLPDADGLELARQISMEFPHVRLHGGHPPRQTAPRPNRSNATETLHRARIAALPLRTPATRTRGSRLNLHSIRCMYNVREESSCGRIGRQS